MFGSNTRRCFRLAALIALAASTQPWGCYLPNPASIKHDSDVRKLEVGVSTREEVLTLLGRPQVVESPGLYVYAWQKPSGFVLLFGSGGPIGLKGTRAILRFDAEGRVAAVETSERGTESKLPTLDCVPFPRPCGRDRLGQWGPLASAFTPDGSALAIIHGSARTGSCVQEIAGGRIRASFDYHPKRCAAAAFSNDGERLAAAGGDRPLVVWSLPDGAELWRSALTDRGFSHCFSRPAFSGDGSRIASHGPQGGLVLRDADTGAVVLESMADGGIAHHPRFSPDDALVVAGIGAGLVLIETETGRLVAQRPAAPEGEWLLVPGFSSDGRYLAAASCAHAELWSVSRLRESGWTGEPEAVVLLPFPRSSDTGCLPHVAFSPDGALLTLVTADAVAVVEVPSGTLRVAARLPIPAVPLAVDTTSNRLAATSAGKLRVCDIPAARASVERTR